MAKRASRIRFNHFFAISMLNVHTGKAAIENVNSIEERRSIIARNSVIDCHLSLDWRQMTSKALFLAFLIRVCRLLRAFSIAAYPV